MKRTIAVIFLVLSVTSIFAGQIQTQESNIETPKIQNDFKDDFWKKRVFVGLNFGYLYGIGDYDFKTQYKPGISLNYFFSSTKNGYGSGLELIVSYLFFSGSDEVSANNYDSPQFLSIEFEYIFRFGNIHCFTIQIGGSFLIKTRGDNIYYFDSETYEFNKIVFGLVNKLGYRYISPSTNFSLYILFSYAYYLNLMKNTYDYKMTNINYGITFGFGFNIL